MLRQLARVADLDRYQASAGLWRAAEFVAAEAAGLTDISVREHPADGAARWWSFAAPRGWTPLTARLRVDGAVALDHADTPFAVATYSAAARGTMPLAAEPTAGAVVVADAAAYRRGGFVADLVAAGAAGFVTDATARVDADGTQARGRIELPPGSPLFAFSLTPQELQSVRRVGGSAVVTVGVDGAATMPVVSATLPGRGAGEVWLTAHLCHPRPSANDNASGVAALLGAARVLAGMRDWAPEHTIRFVWGPEYLATVACLHDLPPPVALINLDMVGEDQALCGSPFVLERPAETLAAPLGVLAEHVVAEVFARTGGDPGTWVAEPFLGFSDHALAADPALGRPSVQFCHPRDRFNHSAADTLDKVSPVELRRSAAAAAVLARLVAGGDGIDVRPIVGDWCEREMAAVAGVEGAWGDGLRRHVAELAAALRGSPIRAAAARFPLQRRWSGPLNVRAMTGDMPAATQAAVERLVAADKLNLALLFNFGIRIDGVRGRDEVIDHTSYSLRRPLDRAVAHQLLDAMVESGWVRQ
jgi:peptidase M28-like protein